MSTKINPAPQRYMASSHRPLGGYVDLRLKYGMAHRKLFSAMRHHRSVRKWAVGDACQAFYCRGDSSRTEPIIMALRQNDGRH